MSLSRRSAVPRLAITLLLALAGLPIAAPALAGPEPGDPAPDFRLQDQAGAWHALGDYRGQWLVLYFYPKDGTPGCTTQACELRDNIFAFRRAGAVIVGISVDDVAAHRRFADEHHLPFTILADADQQASRAYGVIGGLLGLLGFAQRDTFIIDPQGRIAAHFAKVDPKGHSERVLKALVEAQARARAATG